MISDFNFGQLQQFRNQRNDREISTREREIDAYLRATAMAQAAEENDANRAVQYQALARDSQKDSYFNALREREFQTGRTDMADRLKLNERELDIRERQYDTLAGQRDERADAAAYKSIFDKIMDGTISDEKTLGNVAEPLGSDQFMSLLNVLEQAKQREVNQLRRTAASLKSEFDATPGGNPALSQTDTKAFRNAYIKATQVAPETDPAFTVEKAKQIVADAHKDDWWNKEKDITEGQQAVDLAAGNRKLALKRNFQKFGSEAVNDRRLPLTPDMQSLSFQPVDAEIASYFNALRGTTTQTNAAPAAVAPKVQAPAVRTDVGNQLARQIRSQFKAGKITEDEAIRQLRAIGFNE